MSWCKMAEVINLNKRRKAAARQAKQQDAAIHRARYGRSKQEKARDEKIAEDAARKLEGLRREPTGAEFQTDQDRGSPGK